MQLGATDDENVGLRNELADREGDVEEAVDKLSKLQMKFDKMETDLFCKNSDYIELDKKTNSFSNGCKVFYG